MIGLPSLHITLPVSILPNTFFIIHMQKQILKTKILRAGELLLQRTKRLAAIRVQVNTKK